MGLGPPALAAAGQERSRRPCQGSKKAAPGPRLRGADPSAPTGRDRRALPTSALRELRPLRGRGPGLGTCGSESVAPSGSLPIRILSDSLTHKSILVIPPRFHRNRGGGVSPPKPDAASPDG